MREFRPENMIKIHKLYISINEDETIEQTCANYDKAWDKGKEYFKDKPFSIVCPSQEPPKNTKNESMWILGELLHTIANADVVVFVGDWHRSQYCLVEHDCCVRFGIPILYA